MYIFVIGFLLMVQTLVTDMFLPAHPLIATFFEVPDAFVQYSLSAVTLGAASTHNIELLLHMLW